MDGLIMFEKGKVYFASQHGGVVSRRRADGLQPIASTVFGEFFSSIQRSVAVSSASGEAARLLSMGSVTENS